MHRRQTTASGGVGWRRFVGLWEHGRCERNHGATYARTRRALDAHAVAVTLVRGLDSQFGRQELLALSSWQVTVLYTLVLFLAWDLSRYLLHLAMHWIDALWQLHQVHHSAETLTPFTLYRVHPLESVLYLVTDLPGQGRQ